MATITKPVALDETLQRVANAVEDMVQVDSVIDDTIVANNATWSSEKIDTELSELNDTKMDKANPTGTGYMTIGNRVEGESFGDESLVIGKDLVASNLGSVALGGYGQATGRFAVVMGTRVAGSGVNPEASGEGSFANGASVVASGSFSHAEGYLTKADWLAAHAEGYGSKATNTAAHASGIETEANGVASTTDGVCTIAAKAGQKVSGAANVEDTDTTTGHLPMAGGKYIEIVGNGSVGVDPSGSTVATSRSNAYALDWDGNGHFGGDVYVGCEDDSSGGKKVATEEAVDELKDEIADLETGKQDMLTFDATPTAGSANPVTSGGIHDAYKDVAHLGIGELGGLIPSLDMDLLWENPDPTVAFPAQTIPVSLLEYNFFVEVMKETSSDNRITAGFHKVVEGAVFGSRSDNGTYNNQGGGMFFQRRYTIRDNEIAISTGFRQLGTLESTSTTYAIPIAFYGIRAAIHDKTGGAT